MFIRSEKGSLINLDIVEMVRIQDTQVIADLNARQSHISEVVLLTSEDPTVLEEYLKALEDKVCAAV